MENIFGRENIRAEHSPDSESITPDNTREQKYNVRIPGSVTTPSLNRMLDPEKNYPYIVVRYMAATYGSFPVEFLYDKSQQLKHEDSYWIVLPNPYLGGKLTPKARQAVLDIAETVFNRLHGEHMVCAVFGEDDCEYLNLDGSRTKSTSVPSMAIGDAESSK
ncbi:MAG: hypothetical protein J7J88_03085 [Dehalococcoidia bacterium]|nr:hypothetical protein [Dehalococcoidia bacterium]